MCDHAVPQERPWRLGGSKPRQLETWRELAFAVRPIPIELARLQHHGSGLQLAALDPIDRHHLRVIAGREYVVRVHEVGHLQGRLLYLDTGTAQKLDGPPAS